ncbi:QacE family quaternary ammonium compound efflux SMR transporter [Nocardioides immobilis]|uniref:QacE family quaternary ammonium compound efflux SMR transporter n=1 Tax=Nocardioides immobilis TaxID=2049295 RepID=A0A417Y784_9ACTN|nr:multidrug efflux SMR transporter [Nocardioides immobilis]RHW28529.1 QacE family quaternary ammonium compound efflux SMR transporter [Nocardioides immobilis]
MTYLLLAIAIAVEVLATSGLTATAGFTRPLPTLLVVSGYAASFALIAQVVQRMPVGVVYAVWSGVGTAAVAGIGVMFLGESLGPVKVLGLALVVVGVVALNLG